MRLLAVSTPPRTGRVALPVKGRDRGRDSWSCVTSSRCSVGRWPVRTAGPLPPPRPPPRQTQSARRRRPFDPRSRLAPPRRPQQPLLRPRRRLLHQPHRPTTESPSAHPPTRSARPHRHPRHSPRRLNHSFSDQEGSTAGVRQRASRSPCRSALCLLWWRRVRGLDVSPSVHRPTRVASTGPGNAGGMRRQDGPGRRPPNVLDPPPARCASSNDMGGPFSRSSRSVRAHARSRRRRARR